MARYDSRFAIDEKPCSFMKNIILATFFASFLSACATTNQTAASDEPVQDREYQTGSNIPRKKTGVAVIDREEYERQRNSSVPGIDPPRAGGR